ncbi:aftiphilin a [Neosynchiropus ocellatus]
MEPDVIRMYSSSPPPMEDTMEEEDDEFGDFGTFSSVPNSISFTEMDTPTTFNQTQALTATSPPELLNTCSLVSGIISTNGTHVSVGDLTKVNGVTPGSHSLSDRGDVKKVFVNKLDVQVTDEASSDVNDERCGVASSEASHVTGTDCNGRDSEVLTNGFGVQGSPSTLESDHCHLGRASEEDTDDFPASGTEDNFADFAAFSDAEFPVSQTPDDGSESPAEGSRTSEEPEGNELCNEQGATEDPVKDTNSQSDASEAPESQGAHTLSNSTLSYSKLCLSDALAHNGAKEVDGNPKDDVDLSPGRSEGPGSENETETETETSFGRPLSTDALEEFGDMSTTGSAPSPPFQEDITTPAEHSQLAEDDDEEDFGDFGDAGSFGTQGFADFDQSEGQQEPSTSNSAQEAAEDDDDFGDFNSPKFHPGEAEGAAGFASFPGSESFGNFSSAVSEKETDTGWSAFGDQQETETWAAFSSEELAPSVERTEEEEEEEEWHGSEPAVGEASFRTDNQAVAPCSRLEKVFQCSFPPAAVSAVEDPVVSLKTLLERGPEEEDRWVRRDVWTQLQDIHEAFGLRHQWGGSYCNKTLLCCLGIDTRNILFTGQKKQPVIVPMYAASLGMLEPTKEPVKPVSAAEMIASIAQTPPAAQEKSSDSVQVSLRCRVFARYSVLLHNSASFTVQEALPPVQFDWSSSGLTNPLDVSGGSFLLNLDFFGPVEDSGSTSSHSIPGVDPELFELTTAKLDPGGAGSRVADAFARLMSTMEKTSTSTRKPRKDENLSEEASKVISSLPDLSFMTAKVLMFPATLTPLESAAD